MAIRSFCLLQVTKLEMQYLVEDPKAFIGQKLSHLIPMCILYGYLRVQLVVMVIVANGTTVRDVPSDRY